MCECVYYRRNELCLCLSVIVDISQCACVCVSVCGYAVRNWIHIGWAIPYPIERPLLGPITQWQYVSWISALCNLDWRHKGFHVLFERYTILCILSHYFMICNTILYKNRTQLLRLNMYLCIIVFLANFAKYFKSSMCIFAALFGLKRWKFIRIGWQKRFALDPLNAKKHTRWNTKVGNRKKCQGGGREMKINSWTIYINATPHISR